jgi:hypothetical protein
MNEMTSVGTRGSSWRVIMSRDEPANAQQTPSSAHALNASGVGLMMKMVPRNPTEIAAQRRQPTSSLKKITAIAVMISGETRLIADSSARPMWISAVVNSTIARPSSPVRISTILSVT